MSLTNKFVVKLIVIIGSLVALPGAIYGQSVADADFTAGLIKGPAMAMGGAYRALANDNSAVVLNPAGMLRPQPFNISFDWITGDFQNIDVLSGAVIDSDPNGTYAIGFSFDYATQVILGNDVSFTQYTVSLAGLVFPGLTVGAAAKYYHSSVESPFVDGPDEFTADIAALYYPTDSISVALVLQNMVQGTDNENVPFTMSAAVAVRPDPRSALLFDIVQNFSTPRDESTNFHFGGLYNVTPDFVVRSGFGWDRVRDNPFIGAGLGVTAPRAQLGFSYNYRIETEDSVYGVNLEVRF